MSAHNDSHTSEDPVEGIVKHIPVVIPVAGAVLIFLLAFIAVFMAQLLVTPLGVFQGPCGHDSKPAFGGFFLAQLNLQRNPP